MFERPVVATPRIVENHAGQPCYLVEYDEDQWFKYDKEGQDFCIETWKRKAEPLGAQFVVLRLLPDPLFPTGEHTIPYVVRSVPIVQDGFDPFTVSVRISAAIHPEVWAQASELDRGKLKTQARLRLAMNAMACEGCSYEITVREAKEVRVVERGKL
jgi:hypothetical protein